MSAMPKLAVLSQAKATEPAAASAPVSKRRSDSRNKKTITVVVCPEKRKSTSSNNAASLSSTIRLSESDKQNQYPYYERLCKHYGFALDVEVCHREEEVVESADKLSKRPAVASGGPKISHVLLTSSNSRTTNHNSHSITKKLLCHHSTRLIICPPPSPSLLRSDFKSGDVLRSIDGIENPTFDMVYCFMMRGDKLLLDIERESTKRTRNITNTSNSSTECHSSKDSEDYDTNKTNTTTITKNHNNMKKKDDTMKINVLSPSYISKTVLPQLTKSVEEVNRREKEIEEAMYSGNNRMFLDYRFSDAIRKENAREEEEEEEETMDDDDDDVKLPARGGADNSNAPLSIATSPAVDLTFDGDDSDKSTIVNSLGSPDVQEERRADPLLLKERPSNRPSSANSANNDSSSVHSSSSSTSSTPPSSGSSSPSSSSSSSSPSSSSSSSSSTSSSSSESSPPQTIATTNNLMSTPPKNCNKRRFTSISEPSQISMTRPRSSSSISNVDGDKFYPTNSSTMSYPNRSFAAKATSEAPTSLNRLWPDPSDCVKALTKWQPPTASVNQGHVEFYGAVSICVLPPPQSSPLLGEESDQMLLNPLLSTTTTTPKQYDEYKNGNEMMDGMAGPLMSEGLASINNDYHSSKYRNGRWNRDTHRLIVTKVTPVTPIFEKKSSYFGEHIKVFEIQFSLKGETVIPPSLLSELYCLHYHRWKSCKFGIVGHDFPTTISFRTYSDSSAILKLFVCVDETLTGDAEEEGKTGWLSKHDFRALFDPHKLGMPDQNTTLTLMSVGSTTNIVRQFEAISSIPHLKPHIQKALFTRYINNPPKSTTISAPKRPLSLPMDIWKSLQNNHNSYQLLSISNVLSGWCRNNFCLIQGPPGTGKSSTIVGLVSALLSGKAPLPGQKQSGTLIHAGKTMGVAHSEPVARNRILVCAATNQAVDTIAWKIKQGSIGPSGKVGDFKMCRFGSLPWDHVRDDGRESLKATRPQMVSEMEQFLYTINVDRRASDGIQSYYYDDYDDDEEEHDYKCWTPEGRQAPQKRKRRKRIVGRGTKRKEIIGESCVVVTTLSGAGSKAFIDAACRDPTRNDCEFDAVIIDEACVASESETLIPLKFNPTTVTLVGDPRQLPVLSLATNQSKKSLYERSLFERLQNLQWPTFLLRQQYRMHDSIATFPSKQFYDGKLITSDSVKNRQLPPWSSHPCFPTLCFWDTKGGSEAGGFANTEESDFILRKIMSSFVRGYSDAKDANVSTIPISVGIISFYKDQVKSLQQQWNKIPSFASCQMNVKIATVDGFQGSECDVIILSCVRSRNMNLKNTNSIGFLSDERRMNVALTRAKQSLWIVGDSDVLKVNHVWKSLIDHLEREGMLLKGGEFQFRGGKTPFCQKYSK